RLLPPASPRGCAGSALTGWPAHSAPRSSTAHHEEPPLSAPASVPPVARTARGRLAHPDSRGAFGSTPPTTVHAPPPSVSPVPRAAAADLSPHSPTASDSGRAAA